MLEMLEMEFMQRAWLAGLIMAVICPLIGSFLVLRRQSLIGDGLGHIAFAGVAAGALPNGKMNPTISDPNTKPKFCVKYKTLNT